MLKFLKAQMIQNILLLRCKRTLTFKELLDDQNILLAFSTTILKVRTQIYYVSKTVCISNRDN